jgi:hypothetical protein
MELETSVMIGSQDNDNSMTDQITKSEVGNPPNMPESDSTNEYYMCILCQKMICKKTWSGHMKLIHNKIFRCEYYHCISYFATEHERSEHATQVHLPSEPKGRIYCRRPNSQNKVIAEQKDTITHGFFNTRRLKSFLSNTDKDEHILKVPKTDAKDKINPVRCIYCGKMYKSKDSLRVHTFRNHSQISIRCRFRGCGLYFKSEMESDEHFRVVHHEDGNSKKFRCPKCTYDAATKESWLVHFKKNHIKYPV